MSTSAPPSGITSAQKWILGLASLASFMISLDSLVVSTALPTLRVDLNASLDSLVWTVNAYNLTFAVLLITGAALGDRFGRKRVFIAGLGVFTLASVACALATTSGFLIGARAVQGVGAALVLPMALTQISAAFPPQQRGKALGIFLSITGLGTFLGPFVGGLLAEQVGWEWVFWINIPIGLIAMGLVAAKVQESRGPNIRFDLLGVVLVTAGVFGLVWGFQRADASGWGSAEVIVSLVVGVVLLGAFLGWESKAPAPLMPLRFLKLRAFSAGNMSSFFVFAQIYGTNFMLAQFLQNGQGHGPLAAGLRMMPFTVTVLILAPFAGMLADKLGDRVMVAGGMALQAIGAITTAVIVTADISYVALIIPLTIGSCGLTLAIPATQKAVVSSVKPQEIGQASGVVSMLRYLGGVFGIALLGSVFASAGGDYESGTTFTGGFAATMWVIGVLAIVGVVVGLMIPPRPAGPMGPPPGGGAPGGAAPGGAPSAAPAQPPAAGAKKS
ncbi:MFS transporter [Actinosynnema sp. NPDC023794]